ncbi:MAG: ABC transporter ATP-binding protein [Granulosicoccus sp.]|nr:ABC transporter ATP-binding protein [Granulosicoccus sp.]
MTDSLSVCLSQQSPIVLNVDLVCRPGEMLALIGPSGSGKSTVLRTIAGLQSVSQGQVKCGNQVWLDSDAGINLTPQRRRVGMVFQHYALFPHKSVLENVKLAIQGLPEEERCRKASEWLARTNMTGLELRKPGSLSGGQRQRVALARALAREPSALLLDEPFSAVDQQTRRKLYRELAQLRADLPIPILLVTHDISEVQQLADSLCLIHRGRTLQQGAVQDVINAPRTKEIARLLGHQNLISAKVLERQEKHTIYLLESDERLTGPACDFQPGAEVILLIPPTAITVLDAQQNGMQDNLLRGYVRDAVGLGDELSIRMHLDTVTKSLRFRLPLHTACEQGIRTGTPLGVTIRPSGIHAIATDSVQPESSTTEHKWTSC